MAPTRKEPGSSVTTNKSGRVLGCFGFGSKIIKKDPVKPEEKVVQIFEKSNLKVVHDHPQVLPVAKLLLINQTTLIDHESQEFLAQQKDGLGNFDHKGSCGFKFLRKLSFERSKSTKMKEFNDEIAKSEDPGENVPELQKSCRKAKSLSRDSSRRKFEGDGSMAAISILMVILIVMVLFGRLCAIFCASIWFYCMPRFVKTTKSTIINSNKKKKRSNDAKDENSEEFDSDAYRKKVVLQGLLERTDRMYYMD